MLITDLHSLIIYNRNPGSNPTFKDLHDVVFDLKQLVAATSGVITSSGLSVSGGGTGATSFTPYSVILSGNAPTAPFTDTGAGVAGNILTSNGPGLYPTWQAVAPGFITAITDTATIDLTVAAGNLSGIVVDASITYAKIQNVTTGRLLGRTTVGVGSAEEIALGAGLSFSGTTLNANITDAVVKKYVSLRI